jgi:hypothetical protein
MSIQENLQRRIGVIDLDVDESNIKTTLIKIVCERVDYIRFTHDIFQWLLIVNILTNPHFIKDRDFF